MKMNINPRILIASCLGILFVCGAFVLSSQQTVAGPDPRIAAVTGPAPERSYIPITDSDEDGIADWKQVLPSGSNWLGAHDSASSTAATTTRTHTEMFAMQTLERIMSGGMQGTFGNSASSITASSNNYLKSLATDELFTEADIIVSPNTHEAALRAYGNQVAEVTIENGVEREVEGELTILNRATETQDPETLSDLAIIAASYENIVHDMLATPAPRTYAKEHLDLINAYNAILIDVRAMHQVFDDPLYTLVRTKRYEEDVKGLYHAISNLYLKLHEDNIRWSEQDAVSNFIRVIPR